MMLRPLTLILSTMLTFHSRGIVEEVEDAKSVKDGEKDNIPDEENRAPDDEEELKKGEPKQETEGKEEESKKEREHKEEEILPDTFDIFNSKTTTFTSVRRIDFPHQRNDYILLDYAGYNIPILRKDIHPFSSLPENPAFTRGRVTIPPTTPLTAFSAFISFLTTNNYHLPLPPGLPISYAQTLNANPACADENDHPPTSFHPGPPSITPQHQPQFKAQIPDFLAIDTAIHILAASPGVQLTELCSRTLARMYARETTLGDAVAPLEMLFPSARENAAAVADGNGNGNGNGATQHQDKTRGWVEAYLARSTSSPAMMPMMPGAYGGGGTARNIDILSQSPQWAPRFLALRRSTPAFDDICRKVESEVPSGGHGGDWNALVGYNPGMMTGMINGGYPGCPEPFPPQQMGMNMGIGMGMGMPPHGGYVGYQPAPNIAPQPNPAFAPPPPKPMQQADPTSSSNTFPQTYPENHNHPMHSMPGIGMGIIPPPPPATQSQSRSPHPISAGYPYPFAPTSNPAQPAQTPAMSTPFPPPPPTPQQSSGMMGMYPSWMPSAPPGPGASVQNQGPPGDVWGAGGYTGPSMSLAENN